MKLITALVIASSALAANAQAPAIDVYTNSGSFFSEMNIGVADMLDSMAMAPGMAMPGGDDFATDAPAPAPTNGTTIAQLLARNRGVCPQVQGVIAKDAPILLSIVQDNADNVFVDFPLPGEASSTFTFAPTDEAFGKALAALKVLNITDLAEISTEQVMSILQLHVGGVPVGGTVPKNFALEDVTIDREGKTVTSGNSTAKIIEDVSPTECPTTGVYTIDSVLLPTAISDAIAAANAAAAPKPAPAPTGAASSASFGVAAVLAGVVALFA
jgi:hypothetical protein